MENVAEVAAAAAPATAAPAEPKQMPTFTYDIVRISEFEPRTGEHRTVKGRQILQSLVHPKHGRLYPSTRFLGSVMARFGFSDNIHNWFSHEEVLRRIGERAKDDHVRICVQHGPGSQFDGTLLGVSGADKPVIRHPDALGLLDQYGGTAISYANGVVSSTHIPKSGDLTFKISGDSFQNRFVLDTPIDGYGRPNIYLSLLRQVCSNGAVGYAKAFKSEIGGGEDIAHNLIRALDGFDSSDGFDALRKRFEAATQSYASVRESFGLYKTLTKLTQQVKNPQMLTKFHRMTGDVNAMYGLANIDALSVKRQRTLPTKAKVADLINFASEIATHQATPVAARGLQAFIGGLISEEYDLEGTAEGANEFADFLAGTGEDAHLAGTVDVSDEAQV